ncbi:MAG: SDR family NAD(P)-dependent oxidoreductase, partial [Actinophytocola sp.]|uniref:SDR family NAD(P)-dependent oxidoreductase n=1 Tax=Actinophytocola sp. TaxID=1872138 RepID=UPI003C78E1AF
MCSRFDRVPVDDELLLNRTDGAQAAIFALEVALFRLLESWGLRPDFLLGHSIGELAAAQVAGVLSLDDACTLVAARGRLMAGLPSGGAMLAAEVSEEDVPESVDVAAVNGPTSLVVSGTEEEISVLEERWRAEGRRVKRLVVSHAFHSRLMEPMLAEFATVAESLTYNEPRIPLPGAVTDPAYWVRQVRDTVRFADGVSELRERGVTAFLELGPDPVLSAHVTDAVAVLRTGRAEVATLLGAVGAVWARGAVVDWVRIVPEGRRVDLPTYAFQRARYWPRHQHLLGGLGAAGLGGADHPMLGAAVTVAEDDGRVLTGLLSVDEQPWLADHVVGGRVVLPGTAVLELALGAGDHVGCPTVADLTLEAPLVFTGREPVAIQVVVGPERPAGRTLSVHSRRVDADDWIRHATGLLTADRPAPADPAPWPPPGDTASPEAILDVLARLGFDYGPAFHGLTAVWRDGDTLHAEVTLPGSARGSDRFGVHPALLDAVLHPTTLITGEDDTRVPFSWSGVTLHATGATAVRVRITGTAPDEYAIHVWDTEGNPVIGIATLVLRRPRETRDTTPGALFTVDWVEVPPAPATDTTVLDLRDTPTADPDEIRRRTADALTAVRTWLADATGTLVVRTRGALATGDEDAQDLAGAAVTGLVRSARTEHPGRLVLLDGDGPLLLAADEPDLALRDGVLLAPRLTRTRATGAAGIPAPDGAVLITGGTGALGALVARHLVVRHGVRDLVLVSRSGVAAQGAAALVDELEGLGATVHVAACDAADRDAVAEVLAAHRVAGIVHTAGVLDDGVLDTLTTGQLDRVLRSKVDSALVLHDLTRDLPLAFFAVFSSFAATMGTAGQANYAAANAVLDALAAHRRALGLPATAMAWGLWDGGMATHLGDADRARLGGALDADAGLALFDRALADPRPHVVPMAGPPRVPAGAA